MKRGFRALAVLAAVAAMSAGPAAFAGCLDFGGFAIFQCGDRAYFNPPTGTIGTVSAAYWQVGFGNGTLNNGTGTTGTGIGAGPAFNGNDNGIAVVEVKDARTATGSTVPPVGSLCLASNNWGNAGIDGCCDNPRDAALALTKDGILNPQYDVYAVRSFGADPNLYASADWVQDAPMMILLRESSGNALAVAAVSTLVRTGPADSRPGFYNFKDVNNGLANPISGANNVVPWQGVPGKKGAYDPLGLVRSASFDPNDSGASHIVTLGWNDVTVYSDNANRPSTNTTVPSGDMGTAGAGPLVRYVLERQAIVNPADPIGSLNPSGWTNDPNEVYTNPTNAATVTVGPDTCIRLHTIFGAPPSTTSQTVANCRVGQCGDLGYDVASPPSCLGGPLVSESPIELKAIRERAGAVAITWKASAELTTTSYRVEAVSKKGSALLGTVPATETGTGTSASYKFTATATQLKGVRTIEVTAIPSGAKQRVQIQ